VSKSVAVISDKKIADLLDHWPVITRLRYRLDNASLGINARFISPYLD
jgi:hypothetical protein